MKPKHKERTYTKAQKEAGKEIFQRLKSANVTVKFHHFFIYKKGKVTIRPDFTVFHQGRIIFFIHLSKYRIKKYDQSGFPVLYITNNPKTIEAAITRIRGFLEKVTKKPVYL